MRAHLHVHVLKDLIEKSYVTQLASGEYLSKKKPKRSHLDAELPPEDMPTTEDAEEERSLSMDTKIIAYNAAEGDPYGASNMPIYQTATFAQPGATEFGAYDYTRSGNPTRDSLQRQIAGLDGGARAFCFTTGMAALSAVTRLVKSGDEVIVNDDSYGGTYRLMSKVAARQGIRVRYVNMAGKGGPARLQAAINISTRSPNFMQQVEYIGLPAMNEHMITSLILPKNYAKSRKYSPKTMQKVEYSL